MLGECVADGPDVWRYVAEYRPSELWVLADHRGPDGAAIVPGTAYLELARAAFRDVAGPGGVELRDVAFLAPLVVGDDQARRAHFLGDRGGLRAGRSAQVEHRVAGLRIEQLDDEL